VNICARAAIGELLLPFRLIVDGLCEGIIGNLLLVSLGKSAILNEIGKQMRNPLIRQLCNFGDFGLDFLDGLHLSRTREELDKSRLEGFILYLRSGGLLRGCGLLFKKFELMRAELNKFGGRGFTVAILNKVDDVLEHFLLSHGVFSFCIEKIF